MYERYPRNFDKLKKRVSEWYFNFAGKLAGCCARKLGWTSVFQQNSGVAIRTGVAIRKNTLYESRQDNNNSPLQGFYACGVAEKRAQQHQNTKIQEIGVE